MNIGIVSPRVLIRRALSALLLSFTDFQVLFDATGPTEALKSRNQQYPEVLLIDALWMSGGLNAAAQILQRRPDAKILLLTDDLHPDMEWQAIRARCYGCISAWSDPAIFQKALGVVSHGELWMSHEASSHLVQRLVQRQGPSPARDDHLTEREWELLSLISGGESNKQIADQLCISPHTVRTHLSTIFSKLQVGSRTAAALYFFQHANSLQGHLVRPA